MKRVYRGAAIQTVVTNQNTVELCPECSSANFVSVEIDVDAWEVRAVTCEYGHKILTTNLISRNISGIIEELDRQNDISIDEVESIIEFGPQFRDTTDRHAVIVAASWFESLLAHIIRDFMAIDEMGDRLLEGGYSPLGTFSARTDLCYAFGLISEIEFKALTSLRKIRNIFAHDLENRALEEQSLSDKTRNIAQLLTIDMNGDSNARSLFNSSIRVLFNKLVNKKDFVRRCARMPYEIDS
jgi:hypothetical protein